ncbi:hypothetical protein BGZ49_008573 [Haplosporangium sp. Z 27]|nr:hypothetical protein BGZ49_008573 [Haplosporangium sp. Z 27]
MAIRTNKSIIYLGHPPELFSLKVESREIDDNLEENEIHTRNLHLSLDLFIAARMQPIQITYLPGFEIGKPINNFGIAEVIAYKNPKVPVRPIVGALLGWKSIVV